MRVVIDQYIPFIKGRLEPFGEVVYLPPEQMTPETVREADALLVRTRTKCNEKLLKGSKVKFVATATIGFDHFDTQWMDQNGIYWTSAPGCNAQGVCDYVETSLNYAFQKRGRKEVLGIVGVGHVGRLVQQMGVRKGMQVLCCDPIRQAAEGGDEFVSLETVLGQADVITFHTPLTRDGQYPTFHMLNASNLSLLKPNAMLINAARGGVIDEKALLHFRHSSQTAPTLIIDCWEGEPHINQELLQETLLGTYHIAGYTRQGKINATNQCVEAFLHFFGLREEVCKSAQNAVPLQPQVDFDIEYINRQLKAQPEHFEELRESYPLR